MTELPLLSGGPDPVRRRMLEPQALLERQTQRRRSQLPMERPAAVVAYNGPKARKHTLAAALPTLRLI
jgi:hypothetical protein